MPFDITEGKSPATRQLQNAFEIAKERYVALGVDAERRLRRWELSRSASIAGKVTTLRASSHPMPRWEAGWLRQATIQARRATPRSYDTTSTARTASSQASTG